VAPPKKVPKPPRREPEVNRRPRAGLERVNMLVPAKGFQATRSGWVFYSRTGECQKIFWANWNYTISLDFLLSLRWIPSTSSLQEAPALTGTCLAVSGRRGTQSPRPLLGFWVKICLGPGNCQSCCSCLLLTFSPKFINLVANLEPHLRWGGGSCGCASITIATSFYTTWEPRYQDFPSSDGSFGNMPIHAIMILHAVKWWNSMEFSGILW
jgi:hypothetical protein